MRITSREKMFLTVLAIALISFLMFSYFFTPEYAKIMQLYQEKRAVQEKLESVNDKAAKEKELDKAIEKEYKELRKLSAASFTEIPQEEMVLLANDILSVSKLLGTGMEFTEPRVENINGIEVLRNIVEVGFKGEYSEIVKVLNTAWDYPKDLYVTGLHIKQKDGVLQGSFEFEIENLLIDKSLATNLYAWYIDELFTKVNPFAPYAPANSTVRYIYIGEGANLLNAGRYGAFVDISGHWMEKEINEFLKSGYIYINPYNTFSPNAPISRGEFVVLLDNVYKWVASGEDIDLSKFKDYKKVGDLQASYAKAIQKGFLSGFVEGYEDNTLRPNDPITYKETELIMKRIKTDDSFKWSEVAKDITGKKDISSPNWTNPEATLTKAEAIYLLTYFK